MEMDNKNIGQTELEQTDGRGEELDLLELARKLWDGRKFICKWCCVAAVAGLIVAFSIPKEYTSSAVLSPEVSGPGMSGSVSQLAGMMGFNVGNSSRDAVYPMLYPEIVHSSPFIAELLPVEVVDRKGNELTVYDYVENRLRTPWWSKVKALPFRVVRWFGSLFSGREQTDDADDGTIDSYRMTPAQMRIASVLSNRIGIVVDKKTMVVTLTVTMQDPEISAALAQAVIDNLKRSITEYRTGKARNDLEFAEKFFEESKANYEKAQDRYAVYSDRNQNIVLRSVLVEQERMLNEVKLTYNVYNQAAQQLMIAKAKVQESTPVYAVIRPVMVPLRPSKPAKTTIVAGCIVFAAVCSGVWVLFGRGLVGRIKRKKDDGDIVESEDKLAEIQ